jgi:DNA-binding MarR family transcriptional regulator
MNINTISEVPAEARAVTCRRCKTPQILDRTAEHLGLAVDENTGHTSPVLVCPACDTQGTSAHGGFLSSARVRVDSQLPGDLSAAWSALPHALWDHGVEALDLTGRDLLVIGALWRRQSGSAYASPGYADIARMAGLSIPTAKRSVADLKARGLLIVTPQFDARGQASNRYDLTPLWKALAAITADHDAATA